MAYTSLYYAAKECYTVESTLLLWFSLWQGPHLFTAAMQFKITVYQVSQQKCMSFLKCSNLEAKTVILFKLCHQRDKKSTYNLQ